jgi:hypothetical protein
MSDEEAAGEDVMAELSSEASHSVPLRRRMKTTTDVPEAQELDNAIDAEGSDEDNKSKSCSRHSVMALGKLQKTKNMLDLFEKKIAAKPKPDILNIPRKPQPLARKIRANVEAEPEENISNVVKNEDENDIEPDQKFFAQPKDSIYIRSTSKPQVRQNRVKFEPGAETGRKGDEKDENENITHETPKRLDFSDPAVIAELKEFLEQSDREICRMLVKDLVNSDVIGAAITEELITRKDFVARIKIAAKEKNVDMSDLSFALLN